MPAQILLKNRIQYLEILNKSSGIIIGRIDVCGISMREINKIEDNLIVHNTCFVRLKGYKEKQVCFRIKSEKVEIKEPEKRGYKIVRRLPFNYEYYPNILKAKKNSAVKHRRKAQ